MFNLYQFAWNSSKIGLVVAADCHVFFKRMFEIVEENSYFDLAEVQTSCDFLFGCDCFYTNFEFDDLVF